jgi:hypothetical protein
MIPIHEIFIETVSRLIISRTGRGGLGVTANVYEDSFQGDENVLKLDGDSCTL